MFTQKFIKIFHSVQEIGPFSLFQNLALGKASPMINVILQLLGLYFFNIKLSAKFYQSIPNGLRVKFHFFQNLNLGKTSTNPKCHLTISWATSCQYTNVYAKFHHNILLSSRDRAIFKIWSSAKLRPMKNVISQSLGLDLVNINVYAKVYQTIPLSSRDRAIFTFFQNLRSAKPRPLIKGILQFLELDLVNINVSAIFYLNIPNGLRVKFHCFQNLNLGKTSTNPKCHLAISWATSCQCQCVCKISSQYSTQFKR